MVSRNHSISFKDTPIVLSTDRSPATDHDQSTKSVNCHKKRSNSDKAGKQSSKKRKVSEPDFITEDIHKFYLGKYK